MADEKNKTEDSLFDSEYYFDLGSAVDEISSASGAKDTSLASAKLFGKTLFNTSLFVGKLGLEVVKNLPEVLAKEAQRKLDNDPNLSDEKREKLENYLQKHREKADRKNSVQD